jgi:DNA-binding beta-propeller fold protein YncE
VAGAQGALDVIDGATHAVTRVAIPAGAAAIGLNPNTNKVYVATGSGVTVIDGGGAPTTPPPLPRRVSTCRDCGGGLRNRDGA